MPVSLWNHLCAANVFQGQAVCNITVRCRFLHTVGDYPSFHGMEKKHIRCKHVSLFFTLHTVFSKQAFELYRHSNRRSLVIGGFHV